MKSNERKEQIIIAVKSLSPVLLFMAVVIISDALPENTSQHETVVGYGI